MTRVCLLGEEGLDLAVELLASETARDALASYDLDEPYANAIAVETISIGAAVSLLNDLNWYLVRYVRDALVLEPSISETEWLSRALATAIRNEAIDPADSGSLLKIFGVVEADSSADSGEESAESPGRKLTDPMFAQRVGGEIPSYDLRDVSETLIVRVTPAEFGAG